MYHLIYLVIGILLIIGGVFTFRHTQGYIGAGILTLIGVIMILVSLF